MFAALLLLLGKPLPPKQLATAEYYTGWYADAQPLEGFQLKDPDVLAIVDNGPFKKWGMAHAGETVPAKIKKEAIKKAPKLPVRMVIITKGTLVGNTFEQVKAAHPTAEVVVLPGMWEEPSCIARDGDVRFFFKTCADKVPQGEVIRVVLAK